jgi:MFS family permease
LAIGIYGFSQALFQIPFGFLSDRYGRKRMIYLGLLIFAAGQRGGGAGRFHLGVILGRALQGGGAVSAAVMALAADLTREEHRIKVMAFIGITIGLSFAVSMIHGTGAERLDRSTRHLLADRPVRPAWHGRGALSGTRSGGPAGPPRRRAGRLPVRAGAVRRSVAAAQFRHLHPAPAADRHLRRRAAGALRDAGLASGKHWEVYLPALLFSMAAMVPFIIVAEKQHGGSKRCSWARFNCWH